jgi:hypothetical protein
LISTAYFRQALLRAPVLAGRHHHEIELRQEPAPSLEVEVLDVDSGEGVCYRLRRPG